MFSVYVVYTVPYRCNTNTSSMGSIPHQESPNITTTAAAHLQYTQSLPGDQASTVIQKTSSAQELLYITIIKAAPKSLYFALRPPEAFKPLQTTHG